MPDVGHLGFAPDYESKKGSAPEFLQILPSTELAWAAGFFDGEGSACLNKSGSLVLSLPQVDRRPLTRFFIVVQHGKIYGPYGPYASGRENSQAIYKWMCTKGAKDVVQLLWNYLSLPKREQIAELNK